MLALVEDHHFVRLHNTTTTIRQLLQAQATPISTIYSSCSSTDDDDDASSTWARMGTCPILAMADRSPTLTPTARIPLLPRGAPYVIQIKKTEGVQILLRC